MLTCRIIGGGGGGGGDIIIIIIIIIIVIIMFSREMNQVMLKLLAWIIIIQALRTTLSLWCSMGNWELLSLLNSTIC
jgi:hypothetical protein